MPTPSRMQSRSLELVAKDCAVHIHKEFDGDDQLTLSCCCYLLVRTSMALGQTGADVVPYIEAMFAGDTDALERLDAIATAKNKRSQS